MILVEAALIGEKEGINVGKLPRVYLYKGMSVLHLIMVNYGVYLGMSLELPIYLLPTWITRMTLLKSMEYATYGTITAAITAMERGAAINLGGGFHNAGRNISR